LLRFHGFCVSRVDNCASHTYTAAAHATLARATLARASTATNSPTNLMDEHVRMTCSWRHCGHVVALAMPHDSLLVGVHGHGHHDGGLALKHHRRHVLVALPLPLHKLLQRAHIRVRVIAEGTARTSRSTRLP
jgi:hypothetical protein